MPDCLSFLDYMIICYYWMWLLAKSLQISSATLWWELCICYLLFNMLLKCSFIFIFFYFCFAYIAEWGGYWPHIESVLGTGIWVSLSHQYLTRRTGDVSCFVYAFYLFPSKLFFGSHIFRRYMTGKLLLKLDTVKFVVAHHTVIQLWYI